MARSGMALMAALASSCALTALSDGVVGSNDGPTAERWVKITNTYRCMHGVGKVGWSQEAADDAQKYVDSLSSATALVNSNSLCLDAPAGPAQENLAGPPAGPGTPGYAKLEDAVANWYAEGEHCRDQTGCIPPGNQGLETRHFTALVWKGVTQIGCAINKDATIYICRYRSGDSLGPQTANLMPMFFRDSVNPQRAGEAGSFDKCSSDATGALDPSLPDPASLYPEVSNVGEAMPWGITCPGKAPGGSTAPDYKMRQKHHIIAWVTFIVLLLCCICCTCYGCRFNNKKEERKTMPGTLADMSQKHHHHDHEDWRYENYHESEEARLTETGPVSWWAGEKTRKAFAKGVENSFKSGA